MMGLSDSVKKLKAGGSGSTRTKRLLPFGSPVSHRIYLLYNQFDAKDIRRARSQMDRMPPRSGRTFFPELDFDGILGK